MDFWRVYSAAREHKAVVLVCALVTTAAALAASAILPPYYVGATTLLPSERAIRGSAQTTTEDLQATTQDASRDTKIADLVTIAKCRTVLRRATADLPFRNRKLVDLVEADSVTKPGGISTDLIRISVEAKTPAAAVAMANACATEFIRFYYEVSHREAAQTRESLQYLAARAKHQLKSAQADLSGFRVAHSVADLPAEVTASLDELSPLQTERDQLEGRLADINAKLAVRRLQLANSSPMQQVRTQEPPTAMMERMPLGGASSMTSVARNRYDSANGDIGAS
ncbi:MAG: hypothetical protein M1423_10005, partial [Acidobacteria bacterium]|nr:hypothetical protein [Acidobacteriota bacterium]